VNFEHTLKAVDGPTKKAIVSATGPNGALTEVGRPLDIIHVTSPQSTPDFIKASSLANEGGGISADPATRHHTKFANVFGVGDAVRTTSAKTAAAMLTAIVGEVSTARGDRFGSSPLTTTHGQVALAELICGGKATPGFPLDPRVPHTRAWLLKTKLMPFIYCQLTLRRNTFEIKHRSGRLLRK